jgi:hypothetical protein
VHKVDLSPTASALEITAGGDLSMTLVTQVIDLAAEHK